MAIKPVPISFTDWERVFADLPPAVLRNRIFEKNPSQEQGVATLARWGSSDFDTFGSGPHRGFYSLPGLFNGALFCVSGQNMYREDTDGTKVQLTGTVYGSGTVSMIGVKGSGFQHLFVADGSHLQLYQGGSHATDVLSGTGNVSEGDTVQIGNSYYRWNAVIVNGTGDAASPWSILLGADLQTSLASLVNAIMFTGTPGVDFSADLAGQNTQVTAVSDATTCTVTAISDQADGNLITASVVTGATLAWSTATLTGGGVHGLSGVEVPNGLPPTYLATLKQYVLVFIQDSDTFYFIQPGAIIINALDFETAESHPDAIIAAKVTGDTLVILGSDSIECWYPTGDQNQPFLPITGRVFNYGCVEGTVVEIKDEIFFVGTDNAVYSMKGLPQEISNPGVAELVRKTLEA